MGSKVNKSNINQEFIERYQTLWESDQTTRVFAPLAEAYRLSGNLQRALQICRQGLNLHPHFAGGWYQLAKIFADRNENTKAIDALKKTVVLAPENIQAHSLLADLYLAQRLPKDALKSFKMVLLLNPMDGRAKRTIERLESLTADEYSADTFEIGDPENLTSLQTSESSPSDLEETPQIQARTHPQSQTQAQGSHALDTKKQRHENKALEQTLTLVDALLVRNEFTKAKSVVLKALSRFGRLPDLEARWNVIDQQKEKSFENESPEIIQPLPPKSERIRSLKLEKLNRLLHVIQNHEFQKPTS